MWTKMRAFANLVMGVVVLGFVVLVYLYSGKSSVVRTMWGPWRDIRRFEVVGEDQRALDLYFFPDYRAMFWYTDKQNGEIEGTLAELRGSVGTHYFGRLWDIDGSGVFGYRIYPSRCEPVTMEIDTIAKHRIGTGKPVFPEPKETTNSLFLFCPGSVTFHHMELRSRPVNHTEASELLRMLQTN